MNWPMEQAARVWFRYNTYSRLVQRTLPKERLLFMRYEDFCADPAHWIETIGRFAGIPGDTSLATLEGEHHFIGGSSTLRNAADMSIRLDESWRKRLSYDDLATFDRIAGKMNRDFGYQ